MNKANTRVAATPEELHEIELVETTGLDIRGKRRDHERAAEELAVYAQPIRPLELVQPQKPTPTAIYLETPFEFTIGPRSFEREKTANELHWIELMAFLGMGCLAFIKLGILDLANTWLS